MAPDRFIFSLAYENSENYEYWRRSLRLASLKQEAAIRKNEAIRTAGHESPRKTPSPVSYGTEYRDALEASLQPNKLSFSLKPTTRAIDRSKRVLERYFDQRRGEIHDEPHSVLDAPGLRDDYYLNIVDWSHDGMLAVALEDTAYLWNPQNASVTMLSQVEVAGDFISSLCFIGGPLLAMASSKGCVSVFDVQRLGKLRDFTVSDVGRIPSMTACPPDAAYNDGCLTLGTKIGDILHFDPRDRRPALMLREHSLEVCGLARSYDGVQVASGGNDNKVCIWDLRMPREPLWLQMDHLAAVKALDWCPWQRDLLATGAGTADRRIRFWNTSTNICGREIQCEAQVCGVKWTRSSSSSYELVSTHGFSSNELAFWHYPSLAKIKGIRAHESRVLQVALARDRRTLVTAAANEHLKFWEV